MIWRGEKADVAKGGNCVKRVNVLGGANKGGAEGWGAEKGG